MTRPQDGGINRMQCWIPEKLGIVGAVIDLRDDDEKDGYSRGWTVLYVTYPAIDKETLRGRSRDHLKTRRASDI